MGRSRVDSTRDGDRGRRRPSTPSAVASHSLRPRRPMATQPMLTEPTTGTTNGRSRRRKSSRCCVSDCCDAFVVWLTEPLMQDMPPPPIRITIPAGVKPGGAVFVRQASTGANYLVSVPESLLPVRAPPPHRQLLITFTPTATRPRRRATPSTSCRRRRARRASVRCDPPPSASPRRTASSDARRARTALDDPPAVQPTPDVRMQCARDRARHRTYVSHDTDTRLRTSDRQLYGSTPTRGTSAARARATRASAAPTASGSTRAACS